MLLLVLLVLGMFVVVKEMTTPLRGRFPRTPHVVNGPLKGGAVTRDDLTIAEEDADSFVFLCDDNQTTGARAPILTVEEKLDGANLGISLADDGGTLLCQNRSHYVNGSSAPQWSGLPAFIAEVKDELLELFYSLSEYPEVQIVVAGPSSQLPIATRRLGQPPLPTTPSDASAECSRHPSIAACDWIVYGEWLAAQHSVFYDLLPAPFVVFDIYHAPTQRFLSVALRNALMARHCPSLPCAHQIASWTLTTVKPYSRKQRATVTPAASAPVVLPNTVLRSWDDVHAVWHRKPSRFFDMERMENNGGRSTTSTMLPRMMEGVVLRLDDPTLAVAPGTARLPATACGVQVARCKAVHDEFVAAVDEGGHWRKQALIKNIVVHE